jgi:phosphatidylserine/phosphatidylglycerophosphate/cardiolipin synthase-like enzyme
MARPIIARWDILHSLVRSARKSCTVFSPFYSKGGLTLLDNALRPSVALTIWTRRSLRDWASGASDPETLCEFLVKLAKSRHAVTLFINRILHAKAYFADASSALVGSANLSTGGFETNVELMVQLDGEDAETALEALTAASSLRAVQVDSDELADWVTRHRQLIKRARTNLEQGFREIAQAEEETATGATQGRRILHRRGVAR